MRREVYGVGGFIPTHPSGNKVEVFDDVAGTYTAFNAAGTVTTSRSLTPAETLSLNPINAQVPALVQQAMVGLQNIIDAAPSTVTNVSQAQTAITRLENAVQLEAQVLRRLIRLQLQIFDATN